jgi:hypothetical protein
MAVSPSTSISDRLHMGSGNYLEFLYQNLWSLRAKSAEIFNVCSLDYKIICLTETWLNELFSTQFFSW